MEQPTNIDPWLDQLYHLNVGAVGEGAERHERPHKPLMLLTVADLIEAGVIQENRIAWTPELRKRFGELFNQVRSRDDRETPENPFFYLRSEPFWHHVAKPGKEEVVAALSSPPSMGDLNGELVTAKLDEDLFRLLATERGRNEFREALIARYFPMKREFLEAAVSAAPETAKVEDDVASPVRSAAFRRLILETYDYQCVACGLRIRLPNDFTVVDAAHMIPFSVGHNDHPTNGLALCKNHHWAFDRYLITPTERGVWKVSSQIEPRRSPGEAELAKLDGERLLPPRKEEYLPSSEAVRWREGMLLSG